MYCHECGHKLPDEAAFCPVCGTKVANTEFSDKGRGNISPSTPVEMKEPSFSLGSAGEEFINYVNRYVQSTTPFQSAYDLLNSRVSTTFLWACLLGPALVLGLLAWIISGRPGPGFVLALLGLVIGFFTTYVVGWLRRSRLSSQYSDLFSGPIDHDDVMRFLSQSLPTISPIFHEWGQITEHGIGLYGAISAELTNAAQRSAKEVTLGTELGPKKRFFAELIVGPDLLDRDSGKMRYTPDVEHRIVGIFSFKKYTLLAQVAPILHAAMEYYLDKGKENDKSLEKREDRN